MARRFCEVCKQPIDPERAEAIPESVLCQQHSREIQELGGEFIRISEQERTNKAGSLKVNYGGVNTHKVPNRPAIETLKKRHAL
jgi:N-dimethylarginine dimethylaminohydrolase